jgi:hypothetical protein
MDGKLWPWEVLDRISPPQHPNCQCELFTVALARHNGWIDPNKRVPTARQGINRARRWLQESIEGAVLVEAVDRGLLREDFQAQGLRALWREIDVRRDPHGRFDDEPGPSVGRRAAPRPVEVEDTIAKGYAAAAELIATGYGTKAEREVAETFRDLPPDFLTTRAEGKGGLEESFGEGFIRIERYGWDTGDTLFSVHSPVLDYPASQGSKYKLGDPGLRAKLEADARQMAEIFREGTLPTQRSQIRGGVVAPASEVGRVVYPALEAAQAENLASSRYRALRERFAHVSDRLVVVDEKGYGKFPLGINDVLTTASRNTDTDITSINGLAIKMNEQPSEALARVLRPREEMLRPGVDHMTVRSTAALLRHEWGHGMFHALSPERREEFRAMLPDWDEVERGLSGYAAGTEESRADYDRRTFPYGYETETFAEMVALIGGEDYYPENWPGWVNRVADWIEDLGP